MVAMKFYIARLSNIYAHIQGVGTMGQGGHRPPISFNWGALPLSFCVLALSLLIKVTKDELTYTTHKEMYKFQTCTFVCQINIKHKTSNEQ